jgi:hypothetical protein
LCWRSAQATAEFALVEGLKSPEVIRTRNLKAIKQRRTGDLARRLACSSS